MNEFQIETGPVVFLAYDRCGKKLILEEREGTSEGLAGGTGSVDDEL